MAADLNNPPIGDVKWRVWRKQAISVFAYVEAHSWQEARQKGSIKLNCDVHDTDAEATEADK